ncbi:MAG: (2Fe-2S)-binding protein [Gammaproteobacteria bacterium]|nr:(2Fe-2S)-binding protein [Gammaproteobacteria bacterium]
MSTLDFDSKHKISLTLNGRKVSGFVEPRTLLVDFLRQDIGETGTHVGCEHGVCGACTVQLDGAAVRSCLTLAVQVNGKQVDTVEGLANDSNQLNHLQQAFKDNHALQCGFCTPGILMSMSELLRDQPNPSEDVIRDVLSGHLCRCTGYRNIIDAILEVTSNASCDD